jgi:hypothetical protein
MKIKLDFVTNSSSTCYLIYIPATYSISQDELLNLKDVEYYDDETEEEITVNLKTMTDDQIKDIIYPLEEIIDNFKSGMGTSFETIRENNSAIISSIFDQIISKFIILSEDMPGGNDTFLIPLNERHIKIIKNLKKKY